MDMPANCNRRSKALCYEDREFRRFYRGYTSPLALLPSGEGIRERREGQFTVLSVAIDGAAAGAAPGDGMTLPASSVS
jgi:hypothetical protein